MVIYNNSFQITSFECFRLIEPNNYKEYYDAKKLRKRAEEEKIFLDIFFFSNLTH